MTHPSIQSAPEEDPIFEAYMAPIREDVARAVNQFCSSSMKDKLVISDETMMSVLAEAVADILAIDGGDKVVESIYAAPLSRICAVVGQILARLGRTRVVMPADGAMVN